MKYGDIVYIIAEDRLAIYWGDGLIEYSYKDEQNDADCHPNHSYNLYTKKNESELILISEGDFKTNIRYWTDANGHEWTIEESDGAITMSKSMQLIGLPASSYSK